MSTFSGINTAASGLQAQQAAMDTVAHNIANANTPGYKRQQAVVTTRSPHPYDGQDFTGGRPLIGNGADVTTIQRSQDRFIGNKLLDSQQSLGQWNASKQAVDQVVSIIGEPSDTGLSSQLDQFYNTWQQLGTNPEDTAVRNNLLQYGDSAAASLHRISGQIDQLRSDQGEILQDDVAQVNQLAKNLADLNHDIQSLRGAGQAPNDLLDQRDQILGQLSNLADIQVHGDGGSEDLITIGGHALVQGTQVSELATGTDADSQTTVVWKDDSSAAQINGGEIGGVLNIQNNVLPGYLDTLDQVAQGLISSVNALHKTGKGLDGTTGQDFFTGTGARDIQVNPTVMNDPRKIAASANGAVGDGTNAQAIAKTRSQPAINGATIKEAYTGLVTRNATDATNFGNNLDTQTALTQQLSIQQQSATGVSLDEEMTDMIRFQQGYNASARVLSTMDEMLDTLINRLGAG